MIKDIIILTVSYKHQGYCVAGIDCNDGSWIRIVSNDTCNERSVPRSVITFEDGSIVSPLDVMRISFSEHCPTTLQPENWLYDDSKEWIFLRKSNIQEVLKIHPLENHDFIFINNKKYLVENELIDNTPSLVIIEIENPFLEIITYEKRKYYLSFNYNKNTYSNISVTDPGLRSKYSHYRDCVLNFNRKLIVVLSLADKYKVDGKYYKIAANLFGY